MQKRTVMLVMVIAMLLTVSLYFVGGTYARYVDTFNGTGKVSIAKWAVALKDGEGAKDFTLNLTPEQAEGYVVDGKLAPSHTATATAEINLEGTEVAVGVIVTVNQEQLTETLEGLGLTTHSDDIQVTTKVEKGTSASESFKVEAGGDGTQGNPYVIKLPDNAAFSTNDTFKLTMSVEWSNAEDGHNTEHTAAGTNAKEIQIPVTVHVFQYIDGSQYTPTV